MAIIDALYQEKEKTDCKSTALQQSKTKTA